MLSQAPQAREYELDRSALSIEQTIDPESVNRPARRRPASAPAARAPARGDADPFGQLRANQSGGKKDFSKDLAAAHYEGMRRMAAQRSAHMQEKEAEFDQQMDERGSSEMHVRGQNIQQMRERPQRRRPASASAVAGRRSEKILGGRHGDYSQSSFFGGSGTAQLPRRPYAAAPGYSGYVPRKCSDNIVGCTFQAGNCRSRQMLILEGAVRA